MEISVIIYRFVINGEHLWIKKGGGSLRGGGYLLLEFAQILSVRRGFSQGSEYKISLGLDEI